MLTIDSHRRYAFAFYFYLSPFDDHSPYVAILMNHPTLAIHAGEILGWILLEHSDV